MLDIDTRPLGGPFQSTQVQVSANVFAETFRLVSPQRSVKALVVATGG